MRTILARNPAAFETKFVPEGSALMSHGGRGVPQGGGLGGGRVTSVGMGVGIDGTRGMGGLRGYGGAEADHH